MDTGNENFIELEGSLMDAISQSKMTFSSSESSKRACVSTNAIHIVTCLVDGCTVDLSNCRKYHQRHKVCEVHSKSPEVSINGQKLRFCQQCSRFHSLEEFDKGKRSCRKRLDGHNRRRRKPRPYLFSTSTPHGTNNMLQYSCSPLVQPTMGFANPLSSSMVEARSMNDKVFCNDYQHPGWVHNSDHAYSLLSFSTSPSQASCTTLGQVTDHQLPTDYDSFSITTSPLDPRQNMSCLENDVDVDAGWSGMIDMGPGRDHEDPQTLPYYWQGS